ncbi:MAG: LysR family transcriptional regulator [Algicola sp.]|nr:LysR family transcriptional regulator [Algicola sp.]
MKRRLNVNQLISLRYLLEEKNVSRAAKRAFISQPAMSKILNKLRDVTGDPLLIREGMQWVLSPFARQTLKKLTPAIELLEQVLEPLEFDPASNDRRFTIASSDYFSNFVLPIIFCQLQSIAPDLCYQVVDWSMQKYCDLVAGKIDVAAASFVSSPSALDNINHTQFGQDHLICVMREQHPLASGTITMDDYLSYPHICMSNGTGQLSMIEKHLAKLNQQPQNKVSIAYFTAAMELLHQSDCLLSMPLHIAGKMCSQYSLKMVELPFSSPRINYYLLWSNLLNDDPCHSWFRNRLLEIMTSDFTQAKAQGSAQLAIADEETKCL